MENNQTLNQKTNDDIRQTLNTGKKIDNTVKKSANTVKKGVNTVKKKIAKNAKKVQNSVNQVAKISITLSPFFIGFMFIAVIFIACIAHNSSATLTYTDNALSNDSNSYFFDSEQMDSYTENISSTESETNIFMLENILNLFSEDGQINLTKKQLYTDYINELKSVITNASAYYGDSIVGQGSYVYKQAFETTFNYIYSSLIDAEVHHLISERNYDEERTLNSYHKNAIIENNVNYAEIISVMSQGSFTLNEGSLNELFDLLKNENTINKLYSLSIVEKPTTSSVFISETKEVSNLISENNRNPVNVGDVTSTLTLSLDHPLFEEYDINDLSQISELYNAISNSDFSDMSEIIKEQEDALSSTITKKDRTIIFPSKEIPKIEFRTYCSGNDFTSTKKEYQTNGSTITYELLEETITYTTEAHITYIYGDITVNSYVLSDLYSMFGVNPYDYSVDFPTQLNYELLDSVEMGIRTYAPDIDFGTTTRTPFNNSFSSYGLTHDELLGILSSYEDKDLSQLQKSIIELCASCVGSFYTQPGPTGGPGVGFDCSSYTSWVYAQLGIYFSNGTYWQPENKGHAPVAANICKYLEEKNCEISPTDLQVGDLVFWNYRDKNIDRYKRIDHVAIYVGNGMIYEASGSADKVRTREIYGTDKIVSYCRPSMLLSN